MLHSCQLLSTMKAPKKCPSFVILAAYLILVSKFAQIDAENTQVVKSFLRDKTNAFGYAKFVKHENTMLNLTATSKGFVTKAGQCAFMCANSSNGFSFNFVTTPDEYGRHVCEIFTTDKYRSQDSFICKPGVNHYSVASPCSSFPCRNGGTCSPNYEDETYTCVCKAGYDGQQCETPVDHITDYALIGSSLKNLNTASMRDCFLTCIGNCSCVSYQRSGTNCELMNKDRYMDPSKFVFKSGYKYNELKQAYKPEKTPKGCPSSCNNGCCASSPCLNGGTCVETCSSLKQRFYCLCRTGTGFSGKLCDKPMTCAGHGKQASSGMYPIVTNTGQEINVHCDFTSTPGIVWSLIESFTLGNALTFKTLPFTVTYPVNEPLMNWQYYRQSYYLMQETRYNATLWRSTCNYHLGYVQRDSVRGSLLALDIMRHTTGYLCVPVEYINVRGITCSSCTVGMYQYTSTHLNVDSLSSSSGCQWDGLPGAHKVRIRGKWTYDTYFGNYMVYNSAFGCTSSSSSTTQWWLGTPV